MTTDAGGNEFDIDIPEVDIEAVINEVVGDMTAQGFMFRGITAFPDEAITYDDDAEELPAGLRIAFASIRSRMRDKHHERLAELETVYGLGNVWVGPVKIDNRIVRDVLLPSSSIGFYVRLHEPES
jgi:hypothetical protein